MEKKRKPGPPKRNGREPMRSFRMDDTRWSRWKRRAAKEKTSVTGLIRRAMDALCGKVK